MKKLLKWSELSLKQRRLVANGCGGKGGVINPPEYCFGAACNQHDFHYFRGCTEEDRKKADKAFYRFMKREISKQPWWKRVWLRGAALRYYWAVRWCGKKFFNYQSRYMELSDILELENE